MLTHRVITLFNVPVSTDSKRANIIKDETGLKELPSWLNPAVLDDIITKSHDNKRWTL